MYCLGNLPKRDSSFVQRNLNDMSCDHMHEHAGRIINPDIVPVCHYVFYVHCEVHINLISEYNMMRNSMLSPIPNFNVIASDVLLASPCGSIKRGSVRFDADGNCTPIRVFNKKVRAENAAIPPNTQLLTYRTHDSCIHRNLLQNSVRCKESEHPKSLFLSYAQKVHGPFLNRIVHSARCSDAL